MTKKHIFLPIAGLLVLLIGYYFFSLYRNTDTSPNESETIYPANKIIKLNTDIYSPNENDQEQTADTISPVEYSNLPCEPDNEQTVKADTTSPTDMATNEDSLSNETNEQNMVDKYTVFIFYRHVYTLMPVFEVDPKNKTITIIQEGFKSKKVYYRIADGKEVYPEGFGKSLLNDKNKYIIITNDFEQGDYFIDRKMEDWGDWGEKPKTAANIRLFFEALFKDEWGEHFYEVGTISDIKNTEEETGICIIKITDMDNDQNLEYWVNVHFRYGIGDYFYEVVDGELVSIQEFYVGGY